MTYAKGTDVAPDRSRQEIERTLARYGADAFSYGYEGDRAIVAFRADGRYVKLELRVPPVDAFKWGGDLYKAGSRTPIERQRAQRERELWRALALVVKAKLEAVESGIETFDQAFLPYLMLPDSTTVGEWLEPQITAAYETGEMPSLLPAARPALESGSR